MITTDELHADTALRIWRAVLTDQIRCLAILDRKVRGEAEDWVGESPSKDFRLVLDYAGFDAGAAHAALRRLIAKPVHERKRAIGFMYLQSMGPAVGRKAEARRQAIRTEPGGGRTCRVATCGTRLTPGSTTGLCREHNHAAGLCECRQCARGVAA